MPKGLDEKAGILVYFQNTGHLPAKFTWGNDTSVIDTVPADPHAVREDQMKGPWSFLETDHFFEPMWRARNRKNNSFSWSGTITIPGNSSYQGVLWEVPKERMLQFMNWDRPFQPSGKFEYCNGFGKHICNRFIIRYAREPYSRFFLVMEEECFASDTQILHHDPNLDYLSPCEEGTKNREELKGLTFRGVPNP
jgi:hypothetical protein